jgi:hypothetical protein
MKKLLFGLAALPFLAGVASAAEPLSDTQMDRIAAGAGGCLVSVPTDGMMCLLSTNGIPSANSPGQGFAPTAPTTVIADLQKFFNILPNMPAPADTSGDVFAIPLPTGAP